MSEGHRERKAEFPSGSSEVSRKDLLYKRRKCKNKTNKTNKAHSDTSGSEEQIGQVLKN